ncbi:hypothetical protein AO067_19585 [Pseudomonas viridiflava ICMP 13104]|uniref:Uncharacterized protein n=1 Tax=Pseudomonas viridiflava ICMP 13104 TaxID=1198305 RepID=A0A0W0HFC3_PSEVI|nr:hypothetical protein AO067_19585 [Pseudomonas viridiflava ICMP 13104]
MAARAIAAFAAFLTHRDMRTAMSATYGHESHATIILIGRIDKPYSFFHSSLLANVCVLMLSIDPASFARTIITRSEMNS